MKKELIVLIVLLAAGIAVLILKAVGGERTEADDKTPSPSDQPTGKEFRVKDYGAVAGDEQDDRAAIQAAIDAAVAAGPGAKVIFESGTYRISPQSPEIGTWVFKYTGVKGLTLQGNQTELVMTDPFVSGFSFTDSQDVNIRGFVIDYETPPFVQGKITGMDVENRTVDYLADEGYPLFDEERLKDKSLSVYGWVTDKDNPAMVKRSLRNTNLKLESWQKTGERSYRLKLVPYVKNQNLFGPGQMEVGDRFVIGMRNATKPFIYFNKVRTAGVQDVTLYTSPGGGINGASSSGLVFQNLKIMIKPGSGRLRSTNADGLHMPNNRTGIVVMDSLFEGCGDDFINLLYSPQTIQQVTDNTRIKITKSSSVPLQGDTLQIFDPVDGVIRGSAKAAEVRTAGDSYEITLASPIEGMKAGADYKTADHVYNLDADSAGLEIKNSIFRNGRRHGILLKAHDGVIEGNTFEQLYGSAVAVHNEPDWPEGPMSANVSIVNNTVKDVLQEGYVQKEYYAAIEIAGKKLNDGISATRGMVGFTISGNRIIGSNLHALSVVSGERISMKNNTVSADESADSGSFYERNVRGDIIRKLTASPVYLRNVNEIAIHGLQVEDQRKDVAAGILVGPEVSNLETADLQLKLAPGVPATMEETEPENDQSESK